MGMAGAAERYKVAEMIAATVTVAHDVMHRQIVAFAAFPAAVAISLFGLLTRPIPVRTPVATAIAALPVWVTLTTFHEATVQTLQQRWSPPSWRAR